MTTKQQAKLLKKADSCYFKGEKALIGNKPKKAAPVLAEALIGYEQIFGADKLSGNINFAQALVRYGNCVQALGQYAEAATAYTRAIQVYAGLKNKRGVAMASVFLARVDTEPNRRSVNYGRAANIYSECGELNKMETDFLTEAKAAVGTVAA